MPVLRAEAGLAFRGLPPAGPDAQRPGGQDEDWVMMRSCSVRKVPMPG